MKYLAHKNLKAVYKKKAFPVDEFYVPFLSMCLTYVCVCPCRLAKFGSLILQAHRIEWDNHFPTLGVQVPNRDLSKHSQEMCAQFVASA